MRLDDLTLAQRGLVALRALVVLLAIYRIEQVAAISGDAGGPSKDGTPRALAVVPFAEAPLPVSKNG
jgi:hypothetical protein